jgi:multidrug efflux system membrane fusion protein
MTAQLFVPREEVMAHHVSPAQISLNNKGELGLVLVDEDGVAYFAPVTLVMTEPDGIWVGGLPDSVTIVTAGKDFVSPGQRVDVVLEQAE